MGDQNEHKLFSPSGAHVWLHCPGYLNLCSGLDSEGDSGASLIGTAAHQLGKDFLTSTAEVRNSGRSLRDLYRDKVYEYPGPGGKGVMKVPAGFVADSVQGYVDTCMEFMSKTSLYGVEEKLDGSWIDPDLGGTADFWSIVPMDELVVGDYKNGKVLVYPSTPQLKIYAILLLKDNPMMVERVRLFIYQFNRFDEGEPYSDIVMTVSELTEWRDKVLIPAIKAAKDPNARCVPGGHCTEGWCRFGPQKANNCPALLDMEFGPIRDTRIPEDIFEKATEQAGADLSAYTAEELDRLLKYVDIRKKMYAAWEAEAYDRLMAGAPNAPKEFKIVEGRSYRKFKQTENGEDSPEVVKHLKVYLPTETMYTKKLKTVAQLGKALKALNYDPEEVFKDIIETSQSKTMVPVTDKRKAWTPVNASDMFGPLPGGFDLP